MKYARARTYFEAQHWEEAAIAFRDIALNHADRDVGIYAAQLYLESVERPRRALRARRAASTTWTQDVPKFIELYCEGEKADEERRVVHDRSSKIQVDILRLKAQKLVERADKEGGKEALALYEKGGTAYFELFRKYCQDPVADRPGAAGREVRRDRLQRRARVPGGAPRREVDHGAPCAPRVRREARR